MLSQENSLNSLSPLRIDQIDKNTNKMYYPSSEELYREYQFNIIKQCLHSNTLVCLPTGLGKTMIASIIMYNFHKWFHGKIFFFAPTKPLVNQQKNSFTKLFPSLSDHITEINGTTSRKKREMLYSSKKFFFLTPQTLDNDLINHLLDTNEISLLIFDEAHKAQKNYAYTTIVQKIYEQSNENSKLRIIGLSASPGSNLEAIQNVVNGLHVTQIEFRTEQDKDIVPYVFNKNIKIEEIEMNGDINKIEKLMYKLIENRLSVLIKFKVIDTTVNYRYLSITQLLKFQSNFKERKEDFEHEIGPSMMGEIYQTFSLLFQLLNCKKKLLSEGIESFKEGIKKIDCNAFGVSSKSKSSSKFKTPGKPMSKFNNSNIIYSAARKNLIESNEFQEIKNELLKCENKIPSGSLDITHPKLIKLKSILLGNIDKILNPESPSKIIIFSEYKDSTLEILNFCNSQQELGKIKFSIFTGQAKNFSQKNQIEIMEKFRRGEINVLIATSVAEEGLDIGEVDLIICYDFSTTSPIKMIQRFGRTGRKRNGSVIVLATKGEEKSKYFRALHRIKNLYSNLRGVNSIYSKIKLEPLEGGKNIVIPFEWINNVEKFDLEKEIQEEMSDSEYSDDEEYEQEDEKVNRSKCVTEKSKSVSFAFKSPYPTKNTNQKSILKNSSKDNVHNNNIANNYSILSFFSQNKNKKDLIQTQIKKEIQSQEVPNTTSSKLLLSFKILPKKTDSGSKYKIASSCQKQSLKEIPELQFDNSVIMEPQPVKEEPKVDSPLKINDDDLDKIIEEMKEDNSNSKIITNVISSNKKQTEDESLIIPDELISELIKSEEKKKEDIPKASFEKRKFNEYEKENQLMYNVN